MDKNTKTEKKQKGTIFYLLMLLVIFILFVISVFLNEILGMLMFGVLIFYAIIGNHGYKVDHKVYEEILQPKRELLNYDKGKEEYIQKKDNKTYASKWHLLVIALMIAIAYLISLIKMEYAMLAFGIMICYIFFWI